MIVDYEGKKAVVVKEEYYCKAGAYTHKMRYGWALYVDDIMVLGGKNEGSGGAARFDQPKFKTRKALLEYVKTENEYFYNKR